MHKHGLTLGKFAPLHKGHQYLIEEALKEVDELTIIIYDTDVIEVPLQIRANWIKALYPQVNVIKAWDGPKGYDFDPIYERQEEIYIADLLQGKKITHFFCNEYYGEHMSKSLGAINWQIDHKKNTIPINGTLIRKNPYKYKNFISDIVYRDLIIKVVFLGAMSTGKSTITEALALKYDTTYASEYGREYWTKNQINRRISLNEFNDIAIEHIKREEEAILKANKYCFIDTNAITTYMYSLDYHNNATELLRKFANENSQRYDIFFLCDDDIPYDDTWDRSGSQKRYVFQKQIISDLHQRHIPYIKISGSLEERINKVDYILKEYRPYSNYFGNK